MASDPSSPSTSAGGANDDAGGFSEQVARLRDEMASRFERLEGDVAEIKRLIAETARRSEVLDYRKLVDEIMHSLGMKA